MDPIHFDLTARKDIQYRDSYVAFLDVLGFKNLVFSQNQEDKAKLEHYFGIVNEAIKYLKEIPAKSEIGSIIISDSIILSVNKSGNNDQDINILRHLCVAVGLIQMHLALKNIWLRGAISSGKAYFDSLNNQIVGPAYINAFLLEENLAINPRVLLDNRIIEELKFSSSSEFIDEVNRAEKGGLNFSNWGSSVLFKWSFPDGKPVTTLQNDVPLFIDYLAPIAEKNGQELVQLIENIENSIYKETRTYNKYRWIVNYLKAVFHREMKNDNLIASESDYRLNNL